MSTVQTPQVPCPQPYFGAVSPTPLRSAVSRFAPPSTKTATSLPLWRNWTGVLVIRALPSARDAEQQAPQLARQDFAPIPVPPPRAARRLHAFRRCRDRGGDPASIQSAPFERALDRARPQRRRPHGAVGDARTRDTPARHRQDRCNREDRNSLGLDPRDLAEAEHVGACG